MAHALIFRVIVLLLLGPRPPVYFTAGNVSTDKIKSIHLFFFSPHTVLLPIKILMTHMLSKIPSFSPLAVNAAYPKDGSRMAV